MRKLMLFSLSVVLVFSGCGAVASMIDDPIVSFNSINLASPAWDSNGANLVANIDVENPNSFKLPMPKIDWKLYLNDVFFTEDTLDKSDTGTKFIEAGDTINFDVPVKVAREELIDIILAFGPGFLLGNRNVDYRVDMEISFDYNLLRHFKYNRSHSGVLNIPINF